MNGTNLTADLNGIMPILILWVTAAVVLLGDVFIWKRMKDVNPMLSLVGVIGSLWVSLYHLNGEAYLFSRSMVLDPLAGISIIALLVTGFLSILMAWPYLKARNIDYAEYYVLLLLAISGAALMVSANDLIMLFLGLEVLSFGLYILAGFSRKEARSEEASLKYFLLGAFASAFLLYGIALVYGAAASTKLSVIKLTLLDGGAHSPMLLAGIALLLVGLGFKAAIAPFHQWTPDVYEGAPTSVTAFMAGAAKIAAFAALLRVMDAMIPMQYAWVPVVQVIAVLTMVIGNVLAVVQTNVKRMLAYSSIAHAGYLLVAVVAMAKGTAAVHALAMNSAMFYLFAYVFMTLGAFGVLVYLSSSFRDFQRMDDLHGLARRDPLAAYSMMFFMLSLGGIPPTMGFMGKWQIFMAALRSDQLGMAIVLALVSVVAVYYYLRIVWMMCFEEAVPDKTMVKNGHPAAFISVGIAAVATIVFGLAPYLLNAITSLVK